MLRSNIIYVIRRRKVSSLLLVRMWKTSLFSFFLSLCDTNGTAELCEACDSVCLVQREDFVNERKRIYKFGRVFYIWGLCSPKPCTDILFLFCDEKKKNVSQEKETRYKIALLCSARPNGCR